MHKQKHLSFVSVVSLTAFLVRPGIASAAPCSRDIECLSGEICELGQCAKTGARPSGDGTSGGAAALATTTLIGDPALPPATVNAVDSSQVCETPCRMLVEPGKRQFQLTSAAGTSVLRVVDVPATGAIIDVGPVETSTGSSALYTIGSLGVLAAEFLALFGLIMRYPSDEDKKSHTPEELADWKNTGNNLLIGAGVSAGVGTLCFIGGALLPRDFGLHVRPSTQVTVAKSADGLQVALQSSY